MDIVNLKHLVDGVVGREHDAKLSVEVLSGSMKVVVDTVAGNSPFHFEQRYPRGGAMPIEQALVRDLKANVVGVEA